MTWHYVRRTPAILGAALALTLATAATALADPTTTPDLRKACVGSAADIPDSCLAIGERQTEDTDGTPQTVADSGCASGDRDLYLLATYRPYVSATLEGQTDVMEATETKPLRSLLPNGFHMQASRYTSEGYLNVHVPGGQRLQVVFTPLMQNKTADGGVKVSYGYRLYGHYLWYNFGPYSVSTVYPSGSGSPAELPALPRGSITQNLTPCP